MLAGQQASGDIRPSRFVKKSGAYTVAEVAAATDIPLGVSAEGTHDTPIPGASSLAAATGDILKVYGEEETCLLESGGVVAAGAFVTTDNQGRGVAAAAASAFYAYAERGAAAAGELMEVVLRYGVTPA